MHQRPAETILKARLGQTTLSRPLPAAPIPSTKINLPRPQLRRLAERQERARQRKAAKIAAAKLAAAKQAAAKTPQRPNPAPQIKKQVKVMAEQQTKVQASPEPSMVGARDVMHANW